MKKVRKATFNDIQQIATIQVVTWQQSYQNILAPEYLSTMTIASQQEMWAYIFTSTRHHIFVCEEDGQILGFLVIGQERNQNIDIDLEIYALYVLPQYQQQGVGTLLFKQAIVYLQSQQAKSIIIWVLAKNPSIDFFRQQAQIERQERVQLGQQSHIELGFVYRTTS